MHLIVNMITFVMNLSYECCLLYTSDAADE